MFRYIETNDVSILVRPLIDAGAEIFEVGGPVRDKLLGIPSKDHDLLCRQLSMEKICQLLRPFGKVAAVGKSFGVVKFSPHRAPELEIDIALPRLERSTGQGHRDFDVAFDPNIAVEDDLGRRDFTINAMAIEISGDRIIDPFGGKRDLEDKLLRQVFPKAFEEDPLRLIRAVQFAARFGLTIEDSTWENMRKSAHLISTVSGERISQELIKLMRARKPSIGFNLMRASGLLKYILPEIEALIGIEQDKQPGDDVYAHTMRALDAAASDSEVENRGDPELLFAMLMHDIGKAKTAKYHAPSKRVVFFGHQLVSAKLARKRMERMKLASAGLDQEQILRLIENHMFETKASFTERAIRRFVAKVGQDLIFKLLDLRLADNRGGKHPQGIKGVLRLKSRIREELAKKPPFGTRDLALDGNDLIEAGLPEGPAIGIILHELVEKVLDEPILNTREQLLAFARDMIENLPADARQAAKRGTSPEGDGICDQKIRILKKPQGTRQRAMNTSQAANTKRR